MYPKDKGSYAQSRLLLFGDEDVQTDHVPSLRQDQYVRGQTQQKWMHAKYRAELAKIRIT